MSICNVEINRKQKHFGLCSFGRRRNWTKMFLHFGYFLRKGVFLQKGFISAEILYFCRKLLAKMFLQKPTCLHNLTLSAETNLILQKLTSFCGKAGLSVNFGFLPKLSAFCILSSGWSLILARYKVIAGEWERIEADEGERGKVAKRPISSSSQFTR